MKRQHIRTFKFDHGHSVAFSPDSKHAIVSDDKGVVALDLETGRTTQLVRVEGISDVAVSLDGDRVLVVNHDKILLVDMDAGSDDWNDGILSADACDSQIGKAKKRKRCRECVAKPSSIFYPNMGALNKGKCVTTLKRLEDCSTLDKESKKCEKCLSHPGAYFSSETGCALEVDTVEGCNNAEMKKNKTKKCIKCVENNGDFYTNFGLTTECWVSFRTVKECEDADLAKRKLKKCKECLEEQKNFYMIDDKAACIPE